MLKKIDWALLRQQKLTLNHVIDRFAGLPQEEDLCGILHLLDTLQDEAAKSVGEDVVFGDSV